MRRAKAWGYCRELAGPPAGNFDLVTACRIRTTREIQHRISTLTEGHYVNA